MMKWFSFVSTTASGRVVVLWNSLVRSGRVRLDSVLIIKRERGHQSLVRENCWHLNGLAAVVQICLAQLSQMALSSRCMFVRRLRWSLSREFHYLSLEPWFPLLWSFKSLRSLTWSEHIRAQKVSVRQFVSASNSWRF